MTTRFSILRGNIKTYLTIIDTSMIRKLMKFKVFENWFYLSSILLRRKPSKKYETTKPARAILVGHFSFPGGGGTFGDVEALGMVIDWLKEANIKYDVASNIEDGIDGIKLSHVDEKRYGIFIFVCGPWYPNGKIQSALMKKFNHCTKIGVNITTIEEGKGGFDFLLSRDNLQEQHADIALAKKVQKLPVVGILLVDRQKKYGDRQRHLLIRQVITEYLKKAEIAPIWLDTNANNNRMDVDNQSQFESIVSCLDLIITNRLHGLVLGLKNFVPVIAIDPIAGGAKITAQAIALDWPILIRAEEFSEDKLHQTITDSWGTDFQEVIINSHQLGIQSIDETKTNFLQIVTNLY